ncbi:MAG: beta-N-acetylhexosaminidase [Desulfarculus sp.]|nr:beta-N-acetylhexosaminidase [Desulfarculus sp.]
MNRQQLRQTLAQSLVVGFEGAWAGPESLALVAEHGLGGVILFSRNIEDPEQVWRLNRDLCQAALSAGRPTPFVMVDQEGGSVARLRAPFTDGPGFQELGQAGDARALRDLGARLGAELTAAGFNWDLAPVLDVHAVSGGVQERRSLGPDPARVAELGAAFIGGMQAKGCLACAKHFPGLGRTTLDTHRERPQVDLSRAELEAVELVPFARAARAGVAGIMVCHAVFQALDPGQPASLSPLVIEGLLRQEMGFNGLVLSDDLEMGAVAADLDPASAAVAAYLAGCDLLLVCKHWDYALQALERLVEMALEGQIPPERIAQGAQRIARAKSGLHPGPGPLAHLQGLLGLA